MDGGAPSGVKRSKSASKLAMGGGRAAAGITPDAGLALAYEDEELLDVSDDDMPDDFGLTGGWVGGRVGVFLLVCSAFVMLQASEGVNGSAHLCLTHALAPALPLPPPPPPRTHAMQMRRMRPTGVLPRPPVARLGSASSIGNDG